MCFCFPQKAKKSVIAALILLMSAAVDMYCIFRKLLTPSCSHCEKLAACKPALSKQLLHHCLYARAWIPCRVIAGQMFPKPSGSSAGYSFAGVTSTAFHRLAEHLLGVAKRAVRSRRLTRHITALLEEKGLLFFLLPPLPPLFSYSVCRSLASDYSFKS